MARAQHVWESKHDHKRQLVVVDCRSWGSSVEGATPAVEALRPGNGSFRSPVCRLCRLAWAASQGSQRSQLDEDRSLALCSLLRTLLNLTGPSTGRQAHAAHALGHEMPGQDCDNDRTSIIGWGKSQ